MPDTENKVIDLMQALKDSLKRRAEDQAATVSIEEEWRRIGDIADPLPESHGNEGS